MLTGRVYKLHNTVNDQYYIGSTIQKYINSRFSTHLGDARNGKRPENVLHKAILDVGEKNWKISVLLTLDVKNRRELCVYEDTYINFSDTNCLNIKKASGIHKEDFDTKDEYEKNRYLLNKETDKVRAQTRWQKLRSDPIKYEEYKRKKREYEKNWRRCA